MIPGRSGWVFSNVPHRCLAEKFWKRVQEKIIAKTSWETKSTQRKAPKLSQTPEEPSAVAGTSCILLPHSRDRTTQIQQTQWQTLNYINRLGLQTYVCGSDLTISRFFHLHVLTCCSSTFTVCTGRLGRLCLTNWLNLNLAAFREILSLSVPMYMSSCCSSSPLPSLSFLHKQHYLARNYLSQTLQLGSNLTCEISDSAAMTCISQFVQAADLAYWKFMSHVSLWK